MGTRKILLINKGGELAMRWEFVEFELWMAVGRLPNLNFEWPLEVRRWKKNRSSIFKSFFSTQITRN
jgi:hypothetical protein